MKLRVGQSKQANVLVVSLFTASIIGITLASYLDMVSSQNLSVTRSQYWNNTVPMMTSSQC